MKIFIAGHKGMVGSSIHNILKKCPDNELITRDKSELDLLNQKAVEDFFRSNSIDQVYMAAAKVGGILANRDYPASFLYENLQIETNIIHSAHKSGVNKILFLGSSCIYPKLANQPIKEEYLLSGFLEETNEPYALAKIAGIKLCESYNRQYDRDYRCIMPTNLYGPNDNFHPENSHVIPGLIHRFHNATLNHDEEIKIWGTGNPRREFLFIDDMASACIFLMNLEKDILDKNIDANLSHINVGTGKDCSIKELAEKISEIVGFQGRINFDTSKPDGTRRKLLDVQKINNLGWNSSTSLEEGLFKTYHWYKDNIKSLRQK
tara:strand:+ start:53 stop:1012 length:960 start_codon:yes stop_codon:yes gene_type:complete